MFSAPSSAATASTSPRSRRRCRALSDRSRASAGPRTKRRSAGSTPASTSARTRSRGNSSAARSRRTSCTSSCCRHDPTRARNNQGDKTMQSNARADAAQIERPARWAIILGLAGLATLILVLADARPGSALPLKGTRITTTRTKLGTILADARGRTLYLFEKDKRGLSLCTGSCESYWPPVLTKGAPLASGGVKTPLLGTVKRSDGGLQVTYAGHPLYTLKL